MYVELRVYTVKPGAMDAWLRAWTEQVAPLRRKLGFSIPGAWIVEGENRFVWLLAFDGDDFAAADAMYYASPERQAFDPEPTELLERIEQWPLRALQVP